MSHSVKPVTILRGFWNNRNASSTWKDFDKTLDPKCRETQLSNQLEEKSDVLEEKLQGDVFLESEATADSENDSDSDMNSSESDSDMQDSEESEQEETSELPRKRKRGFGAKMSWGKVIGNDGE